VTTLAYNLDHQVTQVTRPDGSTISYQYAPTSGRLLSTTMPRGVTTPTYDAAGRVTNVAGPGGEELAFTYDGSLPKTVTWTGTVSGSLAYSYNSFLETSQVLVTGGSASKTIAFSRNKDAQLTQAGAMSYSYDPVTGFGTGSALGNLTDEPSFNSFGELASYTARAGSATLFEATYTRDKLGRVTTKTETVGSDTSTWAYEYDLAGRLIEVEKDGQVLESYTYDANSNRTAWTDPWGTGTATYDDQDRLTDYAGTTFTYNANGERLTKITGSGTIGTVYDVTGQVLQVTLPSGITIDYVLDAANRRLAKKVNGSLAKSYLWAGGSLVAELDAAGNLETTYVYGRKPHVPEYLLRGSETYRLVTDPLGSVRLVVRVSDGQVVQRLDYSAFGRVLFDSNPGFQPFGYAGGLWEPQTGLVRFGARDYDPEVGRWTAKDPIGFSGGDTNLYGYVVGDPVNLVDPEGTFAWVVAGGLVGAVVNVTVLVVANGGFEGLTGRQVLAATASGFVSGVVGAMAGPLGGTIARGLGLGFSGLGSAVGAGAISAVGGVAGQAVANAIDPCNESSLLNAGFWAGIGGGLGKGLFPTQNLNIWAEAKRFGPRTVKGLFGTHNAWMNLGSFGASAGVGGAANFPALNPF
jgi:RHS repeat-associated protein